MLPDMMIGMKKHHSVVLFKDLTGKRFGKWLVVSYAGNCLWRCRCECGVEKNVNGQSIRKGTSKSCGCAGKLGTMPIVLENCSDVGTDGCWEWKGGRSEEGYGGFMFNYKRRSASRTSYEQNVGEIGEGLCVLHSCDNPPCCNPSHLFLGTNLDNIKDKVAKGRQANGDKIRSGQKNMRRGEGVGTSRLTAEVVMDIRRAELAGDSKAKIARRFGISQSHASQIVSGQSWAHLPVLSAKKENRYLRKCPSCGLAVATPGGRFRKHLESCNG